MSDKGKSMVMAAFVGDALALGVHWIYETEKILNNFGRVDTYLKPGPDSYHPTKGKGDFTHYGDQSFVLLESIAAKKKFDLYDFSDRWRALFDDYTGYVDQATRATLADYAAGKTAETAGSTSDDLAGASRLAPVVYVDRQDSVKLEKDARAQTAMTHKDHLTVDGAAFFALVAQLVLMGTPPIEAVKRLTKERFNDTALSKWVSLGLASKAEESVSVIVNFGQT